MGDHLFKICVDTNIWHLSNLWVHSFQFCLSLASDLTNSIAGLAVSVYKVSVDAELIILTLSLASAKRLGAGVNEAIVAPGLVRKYRVHF